MKAKPKAVKTFLRTNINKLMVIDVQYVLSFGGTKYYKGKYVRTIKE